MGTLSYRPEIDGLRAVAVLPVLAFHLHPGLVPGGFMGVDVFFVISGFLITSIILRESAAGTFTLANFWMRRIRRLFPALAAVLLATVLAGVVILYGSEWRSLGSQLTAVLALVANIHMWRETGDYWGPAAEEVPLLHTWSLAVEEQFYLIFPILMLILIRFGKRAIGPVLLVGALASLAHGIASTGTDSASAFYLLPARAWELLIGCLLAAWTWNVPQRLSSHRWAPAIPLLGLAMIVASYFLIRSGEGFPGYKALMPTLGTFLVLGFTGPAGGTGKAILSAPPLVFVGKISYSLYLWHWPIIVFWRLHTMEDVSAPRHAIPIVLVSFAAATLSWFFVEKAFRRPDIPVISSKSAVLAASFAALLVCSLAMSQGRLHSLPAPAIGSPLFTGQDYNAEHGEAWKTGGVLIGTAPPEFVVIGSSHAIMYGATIAEIAREQDQNVSFLCIGNAFGRFHTPGDDAIFRDGIAAQRAEFDHARTRHLKRWHPQQVVWIGRWDIQYEILGPAEFDRLIRESIGHLLANADRVLLFTQPPFCMDRPGAVPRFASTLVRKGKPVTGREDTGRGAFRTAANNTLRVIGNDLDQVELVEIADLFEMKDGAVRILSGEGELLYHDDNHLSDRGASLARERIVTGLKEW